MVLENKQSTVAYRCPSCGSGVMSVVDMFRLSADMIKLKCTCGKSEMSMVRASDGKVRFTVPCMLCPNDHSFTVSQKLLFNNDLFVLPCPYSGINIGMMGEINHVKAEMSRTELELLDMLEQSGIDSFDEIKGDAYLSDPQILEIVSYMIKELDEEGRLYCDCPEDVEGNYQIEMTEDGLLVSCLTCGASKLVPTNSLIQAMEFLNADCLRLEKE